MIMDDSGAWDSNATTVTIAQVRSDADVFLTELWAPETIKLKKGKRKSKQVIALGSGTSVRQGATVNLLVTTQPTGLSVVVESPSDTEEVTPGEDPEQFEFKTKITCMEAGSYTIGWSATIGADQNSDLTNDTLIGETSVLCTKGSGKQDKDEEEMEEEEEDEEDKDDSIDGTDD
jgi:hypothetical protein